MGSGCGDEKGRIVDLKMMVWGVPAGGIASMEAAVAQNIIR